MPVSQAPLSGPGLHLFTRHFPAALMAKPEGGTVQTHHLLRQCDARLHRVELDAPQVQWHLTQFTSNGTGDRANHLDAGAPTQRPDAHTELALCAIVRLHLYDERSHLASMVPVILDMPSLDRRHPGPCAVSVVTPEQPGHIGGFLLTLSDHARLAVRDLVLAAEIHCGGPIRRPHVQPPHILLRRVRIFATPAKRGDEAATVSGPMLYVSR